MQNYGVLKAKVLIDKGEYTSQKTHMSHYNLITVIEDQAQEQYQVNIDIQSTTTANVRMYYIDNYQNTIVGSFDGINNGFTNLQLTSNSGVQPLDYLRENLFDISNLANQAPLSDKEISSALDKYLEDHEHVIVFGTMYDDQTKTNNTYGQDRYKNDNSLPSQGVHNVHMNQGSTGSHASDNGIYQDGALFVKLSDGSYTAFFFAFSQQCFSTDNNGNCNN